MYEKMNTDTTSQADSNKETPTKEQSNKVEINQEATSENEKNKDKEKSEAKDKSVNSANEKSSEPVKNAPIQPSTQPKESPDIARAVGQNQKMAINALYDFHKNITEHKLQNAYGIFSPAMQNRVSYNGWAPGFKTTVSSTPSDVKVASETDSRIVLTYYLQAVDNPGGTQNFTGTAVMVKVGDSWKIDDVTNKVK